MVAWIVIACIVLFFVLLFTVHAYITIDLHDDLALTVRVLGIPIRILPKKPKKYKISHYSLKKIRKRDAKAAKKKAKLDAKKAKKAAEKAKKKAEEQEAEAKLTKAEKKALKKEKKAKRPKLTELIPLVARVAGLFFSRFFGKLHIKVARIHIHVGSADAATTAIMYGVIHQSVSYLMLLLGKMCHVDGLQKADVAIVPDYTADKISFDVKLTFRVSLGNVVGAALKAGIAFLRGYLKIKPDPDNPRPGIWPELPDLPPMPPKPDAPATPDLPESPL